ncbi:hypothetical protein ABPG74_018571 [Tetrahymena malaccensis]
MYIKEIIIEGFKSYATRTIIKGFDQQFNAITGFNGSGKSNILDSILFVLGLNKDWELLRVKKVQELVYKQGHAGITKAEVTVIFDNSNKEQSPLGYESYDTISVTRQVQQEKSKYFVNGTKLTLNQVKNMFRSVQLNIDNPHFLVAQGRITKIINLKPQELISMLEETAGTALYNEKKRESEKIIKKKEEKVKEINDLIDTDIQPKMRKLKEEKEQYLIWKSSEVEINKMDRKLKAYDYFNKNNLLKERMREIESKQSILTHAQRELTKVTNEYQQVIDEMKNHGRKQDAEKDKQLSRYEQALKTLEDSILKQEKEREIIKKHQISSMQELKKQENKVRLCEENIAKFEKDLEYSRQQLADLQTEYDQKKENLNEINRLSKNDSGNIDAAKEQVDEQIAFTKNKIRNFKNDIAKLENSIKQKQNIIKNQKENIESAQRERESLSKKLEILEKEIKQVEEDIDKCTFNVNELRARENERANYDQQIMKLNHNLENILNQNGNWIFKLQFRDPEPNFDRSKIKGRILSLFKVKSPEYFEALEAGAGGKLLNIVTEDEQTSKLMLKKNCFSFNVRFIPNNKIVSRKIDDQIVQEAQHIAKEMGGWALPAYDLIEYDKYLERSMLFVFGNFIVTSNQHIAKQIAFNQNVRMRIKCVTLEGDILDPQGTLQGGYSDNRNLTLTRYANYRNIQDEKEEIIYNKGQLQESINYLKKEENYYNGLKEDLQNKKFRFEKFAEQLRNISGRGIQEQQDKLEREIQDDIEMLARVQDQDKRTQEKLEELNNERANLSKSKDTKEVWKKKIQKLKQEIEESDKELQNLNNHIADCEVNIEHNKKDLIKSRDKVVQENKNIEDQKKKLENNDIDLSQKRKDNQELKRQKDELELEIQKLQGKRDELEEKEKTLKQRKDEIESEVKKIEEFNKKITAEITDIRLYLNNLEKENEFIRNDRDLFGQQGSEDYDFSKFNLNELKRRYHNTVQEQQIRQKQVNFKVEAMSEKVEKDYQQLNEKRQILENDKILLFKNMDELDKKKQETLEKCYLEVNKTFGQIFSDLLPGAAARIQPPEGQDVSAGLELGVAFNNVWKTSLSELSGGQRSLLALSFVLALLKYKPAPFYILDEVDSALDLSHTENIGYMISQRFQNSQFLLISLKDGMYQNANVLFKTSFVDGVSKVDRIPLKKKITNNNKKKKMEVEDDKENQN